MSCKGGRIRTGEGRCQRLAECVDADTENARKIEILQSVKGLGPVTVSTLPAKQLTPKLLLGK